MRDAGNADVQRGYKGTISYKQAASPKPAGVVLCAVQPTTEAGAAAGRQGPEPSK
jgi:hypothetical protein